jgi:undecaprenyl-diphosphatase
LTTLRTRAAFLVVVGLVIAAAVVFVELTDSVRENDTVVHLDERILDTVARHRAGWLTATARTLTVLGNAIVVAGVVTTAAVLLAMTRHRLSAAFLLASVAGAGVLVFMAKEIVGRPRPLDTHRLVATAGDSFPSGHAAQGVACYVALALVVANLMHKPRGRVVVVAGAVIVAFVVGSSRVYLGAHWTSDVVAGWLLAAGWLVALTGVAYAIANRDGSRQP